MTWHCDVAGTRIGPSGPVIEPSARNTHTVPPEAAIVAVPEATVLPA